MPTDVIIDPSTGQIYWNDSTGSPQSVSIKGDAINAISFVGYSGSFSPGSTPAGAQTLVTVNDNSGTDALVPGTSGFNLGSSTLRWNTFATNANLSGTLVVSDATNTSSLITGSVRINGGIAISGNAAIGQTLLIFNGVNYSGFRFAGVANTIYTLPETSPATGSSVLQSTSAGIMSWVPLAASSSSGGTVASGIQYQLAGYYSGTGASVSGSATFLNNTAIGQVQIAHTTASFGTSSGALQVAGGVGISGRLSFNQASFGTTGISTLPTMAMIGQTGDPIYMSVLEDNSISFEGSQGQLFSISPNLTTGYIWAVNDISGVPLLRSSVGGTIGIAEFGGVVGIGQTNPTYKLDLKGSFGLASSNDSAYNFIFSNSAASGSNSLQIRSANSLQLYNTGNTFFTAFKSAATSNVTFTLPVDAGSSGQFLQTNGSGTLTWATATGGGGGSGATGVNPGGQYQIGYYASTGASIDGSSTFTNNTSTAVVSIGHATVSTSIGSGALQVSGGVGIGGSLYVGGTGSSISGVRIASGAITVGAWNGTVVATQYGGTGQNLSSSSGILTISSGTVSASTTSSAIANALSDETGSGALVFATSPVLVTPDIGAATGTSLYLSAVSPSTTVNTGALRVPGGVGIGQSVSIGGYLQLFNTNNYTSFVSSATANTVYTLPATSPATGSSVLQSTSTGIMSWVPMTATGGGAGTVAVPDAQFRLAYYAGTGASVSSTNLIVAVGTGVTILGATNASSSTTAAFSILGGLGVTGNAFIGGTVYVPSTTASNFSNLLISNNTSSTSTSSGALVVTGGFGIAGNAFIGGTVTQQNNTSSIGTNSGAITVVGGVGIAGNAFIGGTFVQQNNTSSVGTNSGAITVAGGVGIAGNAFIGGTTTIQNTQATTSSSTGALVIIGGASVGQTLSVGGSLNIFNAANYTGFRFAGSANTTYTLPSRTPTGTATSYLSSSIDGVMAWVAAPTSGGSGSVSSGTATYAAFYPSTTNSVSENANLQFTGTGVSIGGRIDSTSTTSGSFYVYGGIGVTGNAFIGGTAYIPSTTPSNISNLLISNNTSSTSTSSGALVVNGGLGIAGNAFIGGTFVHQSTASSVGTNSGSVTLAGGVGIAGNAFIGGTFVQTNSTSSVGTNSGSMSIAGGVGIAGNAFIGGTFVQQNSTSSVGTNSGAITVAGGLGLAGNAFIGGTTTITSITASVSSDSGALVIRGGVGIGQSVSVGGSLNIFNAANYTGFRFAGSANTTYTLPPRTPTGTGSSYLSSSIDGVMAWVAAPTAGGGSPGGSNKQIQFNNSNAFGGAAGFEFTTGGIANTVSVFSASGTGYTAGLWVHAINGTTTRVGIGLSNPAFELEILGEISATNKSFVIDHPTKDGMKLRYGSLEGPENGVYVRGELKGTNIIEVPDHWVGLVYEDSYTVHLTPIGRFAHLYVEKIENYNVFIADNMMCPIHCYYSVWAERKDIPKLVTEYEAQ